MLVYLSICHSRAFSGTWKAIPRGFVQHMANSHICSVWWRKEGRKWKVLVKVSLWQHSLCLPWKMKSQDAVSIFSPTALVNNAGRSYISRACSFLWSSNLLISQHSLSSQGTGGSHLPLLPPRHSICPLAHTLGCYWCCDSWSMCSKCFTNQLFFSFFLRGN